MGWTSWEKVAGWGFEELIYEKKYHTELEGGVARITINRPQRMNTLGPKVLDMMTNAFYEASNDSMIGVVVLTGVGDRAFCVGGDVDEELETAVAGTRGAYFWKILPANRGVRMCRKPVIARVNGYCIGGGNHLAYWCDFTIAADHAIFGQNGPRVSSPADANIVSYLTYVVGATQAIELCMLCRRYTARYALEMGLVNRVVPFDHLA